MSEHSNKNNFVEDPNNIDSVEKKPEKITDDLKQELKEALEEVSILLENLNKEINSSPQNESLHKSVENIQVIRKQLSDLRNKELPLFTSNDLEEE